MGQFKVGNTLFEAKVDKARASITDGDSYSFLDYTERLKLLHVIKNEMNAGIEQM